ncbi:glutamate-cysteine ligase family protein [Dactylosporangium siamense]|uniref:Glutamate--cysteine ligase EgtA n=1 Tax=Dactylosporangium siamense TaxID=685454 RepID=A0A919UC66_9ACTN|nr:glutamate-cysteine ligase family protein [Dactylosporangium siamense]GIG45358.1 glutamate--cysteine ligase EgtA [Dactylosporangium siamense]
MRTAPHAVDTGAEIRQIEEAEGYIASICFKTGPPTSIGVELEHIVHTPDHPTRPLDTTALAAALGGHAPAALDPDGPHDPMRHGGVLSIAPGGQIGLAARPQGSLARLHATVNAELGQLTDLITRGGFGLAGVGIDPHHPPRRVLSSPRYQAMAASFARRSSDGRTMMCSTAGLRPSLDAGPPGGLADRWAAVHELGPTLLAVFANSPVHAGRDTGWASTRMRTWYGIDPGRAGTVPTGPDPAEAWARYALRAPLLCVRRPTGSWAVRPGVTFADWITGALPGRPTFDDLDYHLGTLFPLVRPRGHLQVRYLDTQPGGEWFAPVAVLAALLADRATIDTARELCAPAAGRWLEAARYGLTDAVVARTAPAVLDLALRVLERDGLPEPLHDEVVDTVEQRFRQAWPHLHRP